MFRLSSRPALAAAAVGAAAAIAACGSSSPSASSASRSGDHLTYAQAQRAAVNFASCMRAHGVTNFPDPSSPRAFKDAFSSSAAQAPAFQSAAAACRHLLPGGGPRNQSPARPHAQIAAELAFARCLRSHGFPDFPDPTSTGQLTHEMLANAGINIHLPAVVHAADACVSVTHGFLTRAAVARFVAGH